MIQPAEKPIKEKKPEVSNPLLNSLLGAYSDDDEDTTEPSSDDDDDNLDDLDDFLGSLGISRS